MRVLNRQLINGSGRSSDESAWLTATLLAQWHGPADVTITHPLARPGAGKSDWVFPLPNDGKVLTALVSFRTGDVSIKSVV